MATTRLGPQGGTALQDPARPPSRRREPPSVAQAFDPRRNSLGALRLGLALLVAVTHATAVGFGHQPRIGGTNVSDVAVDAFFVLSGFLVTRSLLRLPTLRRYVWHRLLRIMPAFWVCLVVTAVLAAPLAAVLEARPASSVLTAGQDPAWRYPLANAALPMLQYGIAGLGQGTGAQGVFDGSLWTLKYEAACYLLIAAVLGAAGLRRYGWAVLALCAAAWAGAVVHAAGGTSLPVPVLQPGETERFVLAFALGAAAHVHAGRIPVRAAWAVLSAAVLVLSLAVLPDYELLGAPALAYLCVWAAIRVPAPDLRWDLSYGVYIYHWPIQLLLALGGLTVLGEVAFAALGVLLALCAGALSWLLVERRALSFKDARWVDAPLRRRAA